MESGLGYRKREVKDIMKKKKYDMVFFLMAVIVLCACGEETSEQPPMTVSQEIASSDLSENIVPIEATEYSRLNYSVPEGFAAANDNTDVQAIYVSETQGDYSYICYTRQNNDGTVDYGNMSSEDMAARLSMSLQTDVSVEQYTQSAKEGWEQVDMVLSYEQDGIARKTWQNIYITEKYIFIMAYVQAGEASWEKVFTESASQAMPQSIVEQTTQTAQ